MKNVIDGVEITPEIIEMIKDWAPASDIDISVPEMHIQSLSKIQDFITRQLDNYCNSPEMMIEIAKHLNSVVIIKDSLTVVSVIWKGDKK